MRKASQLKLTNDISYSSVEIETCEKTELHASESNKGCKPEKQTREMNSQHLSLAGAATHTHTHTKPSWQAHVCWNTSVMTKVCLPWQNYACHDNNKNLRHIFVTINRCLSQQKFCCNILLSWQKMFCCNKHMFNVTKQACHDKTFVVTNTCLLRQKRYLWQLPPMVTILLAYTSTLHLTTGVSSAELLLTRMIRAKVPCISSGNCLQSSTNKPVGTKAGSTHPDLDFGQKTNLYAYWSIHGTTWPWR